MPSKPTPRDLFEKMPTSLNGLRLDAEAFAALDAIGASSDLVPAMTDVLHAHQAWAEARADLAAFDESVATERERATGKTSHDWSKVDPTRYSPDTRAEGERLWHIERGAKSACDWAEVRYKAVRAELLDRADIRARLVSLMAQRVADADAQVTQALEELEGLASLARSARVARGMSLALSPKPMRTAWAKHLRALEAAIGIERATLADPDSPPVEPPADNHRERRSRFVGV